MHVLALDQADFAAHFNILSEMYRLRRRVFRERLQWDVSVAGEFELDLFDTLRPTYLVLIENGSVAGCVRFLPTTGPTMLASTFAGLLGEDAMPRDPAIVESSRFCIDTGDTDTSISGLRTATHILLAGMIEWGKCAGLQSIITVTDLRMERVLRRAGWPLLRIGQAQSIGTTTALAGYLAVSDEALACVRKQGQLTSPVLRLPASAFAA